MPILAARLAFALLLTAVFPFDPVSAQDLDAGVVKSNIATHLSM